ncbi:MAG: diaminopimelate decarboxylase, partial [Dehalococcoidales bacterium]|nr:diaminopimelate decarboxylase [Dehalococcoidales bacterium]
DSKFGFTRSTWDEAVKTAVAAPNLNPLGLHFHLGSGIHETEPYEKAIDVILDYAAEIRGKFDFKLKMLSIGGGYAARYSPDALPPAIARYAEVITGRIQNRCAALELPLPKLIIEPGRSIVAEYGVALYRIGVIKEIPGIRTYVNIDGGMGDNIRQPLYGYAQEALVANRAAAPDTGNVTISGKYCEAGDVLIPDIRLPEMQAGDILAVAGSGAYAIPLASNYNASFRPAIVFIKEGEARLVRRRETLDDLTRRDIL